MFPAAFDYRRPESVDEALSALAASDAVALAGGHSLVPDLKARERTPGTVVDLGGLDSLRGVELDGDELVIGALTTYADLLAEAPAGVDVLLDATRAVGDRQIRNRGTVGGNLAAAEARGDLPAAAVAGDATLVLRCSAGRRTVAAEEFFRGDGETACGDDELLTEIRLPTVPSASAHRGEGRLGGAYAKKTHPSEGYAAVGVAARVVVTDGEVTDARVAVNGVFDRATRLDAVEEELIGVAAGADPAGAGASAEAGANAEGAIADAADHATDDVASADARSDHLVSGAYRVSLLPKYTRRAISPALARATGAAADDGEVVA